MVIAVIGGGASGMTAALVAAKLPENKIYLFERQARLGRKLQATGNGRCNLSNLHAEASRYHGNSPEFTAYALAQFPPERTLEWFYTLGLYTVAEPSGRVYPYSDQANSVVDILRFALDMPNIQVKTGCAVERIRKIGNGFRLEWSDGNLECDRIIVACGGLAGSKLGGSLSGYRLLQSLGHSCTRLRPSLVQIKTAWNGVVGLKGVRANCRAEIWHNGKILRASTGELQFTEYGLSGPVIFELSRDICQEKGSWVCRLDFLPDIDMDALIAALKRRRGTSLPASELFTGILHNRLGRVLTQAASIRAQAPIAGLSDRVLRRAAQLAKGFDAELTEPLGMDSAQVTAGGIVTAEFEETTMESKLVPGLYACGEVLDVDGDCGGYNLQWAWSSGTLAGLNAGRENI